MTMIKNDGWIGVDLDGTLAHYDGWVGIHHVGAPIEMMVRRVRSWLRDGKTVKIMTARVFGAKGDDLIDICKPIWEFCDREFGQKLEITCVKDMQMIQLWDDRAVQVIPNTGIPVEAEYNSNPVGYVILNKDVDVVLKKAGYSRGMRFYESKGRAEGALKMKYSDIPDDVRIAPVFIKTEDSMETS